MSYLLEKWSLNKNLNCKSGKKYLKSNTAAQVKQNVLALGIILESVEIITRLWEDCKEKSRMEKFMHIYNIVQLS